MFDALSVRANRKSLGGNKISTKFNGENIETTFKLEKLSQFYPEPSATVCLNQVLSGEVEQQIKCLARANPKLTNFVIKPSTNGINKSDPYIHAFFYKTGTDKLKVGDSLNVNDTKTFIPFSKSKETDED